MIYIALCQVMTELTSASNLELLIPATIGFYGESLLVVVPQLSASMCTATEIFSLGQLLEDQLRLKISSHIG